MATVTALTADRMIAIEDSSIVSGVINDDGHLILTTHGGDEIDAGNALVAVADASTTVQGVVELATTTEAAAHTDATRAVTPAGLASYDSRLDTLEATDIAYDTRLDDLETAATSDDTRLDALEAKGLIAYAYSSSDTAAITTGSALQTGTINWVSGKAYRITHGSSYRSNTANNQASMFLRAGSGSPTGGTISTTVMDPGVTATNGQWFNWVVLFHCTSNQSGTAAAVIVSNAGNTTGIGGSGRYISVEDMGPSTLISAASGPSI